MTMLPTRPRSLSLARIIEKVAPRLQALTPPESLQWLAGPGGEFGVTTNCILELHPASGVVDFAMPVFGRDQSLHELAGGLDLAAMVGPLAAHATFGALRPLARQVLDAHPTTALWLEWDSPAPGSLPAVSVYIDVPKAAGVDAVLARARLLGGLGGASCPPQAFTSLADAVAKLPAGTSAKYLGRMLSRGSRGIRLAAKGFAAGQVLPYLGSIGWAHPTQALERWLAVLGETWAPIAIQIDLEDTLPDRLSLNIEHPGTFGGTPFWPDVFARMVREGIAREPLYEALCAWEGRVDCNGSPEELFLQVNHVKVALNQGRPDLGVYLSILRY